MTDSLSGHREQKMPGRLFDVRFVCAAGRSVLPLHPADGFDAHASAANYFDVLKFALHKLYDGVVLRGRLHKFQKKAVIAVINDS